MDQSQINLIGTITASVISILSAYTLFVKVISPFFKRIKFWMNTWENFMIDWAGQEARPGRAAVPGVMERLNNIDGELRNNGGSSIKDAIDRIEKRLDEGANNFDEIEQAIEKIDERLSHLEDNK